MTTERTNPTSPGGSAGVLRPSWEYGQVVVSESHAWTVQQADEEILVSLELVANADHRAFNVNQDWITIGSPEWVVYRVTGWHPDAKALICERTSPIPARLAEQVAEDPWTDGPNFDGDEHA